MDMQCYDEQGRQLAGKTVNYKEAFAKGILHGASHVWTWRQTDTGIEVLLQKRSSDKITWPDCFDVSAAGHIDPGEDPVVSALREIQEEIGVTVPEADLQFISAARYRIVAPTGAIENEIAFIYLAKLAADTTFTLQESEVAGLEWRSLDDFERETTVDHSAHYVPHGAIYYAMVVSAIRERAQQK